jgi:radical SAM protein with 4Fe4S-binding SPASM domain
VILETLNERQYDYVIFKIVRDYEDRGLGLKEKEAEELKKIVESIGSIDRNFTNLDTIFDYRNPVFIHDMCISNEMGLLANVNSDGKVYPNIVEIGDKDFCIGDLHEQSLEEMWHGTKHKQVKVYSNRKWSNRECRNCRSIAYNNNIYGTLDKMPSIIEKFI